MAAVSPTSEQHDVSVELEGVVYGKKTPVTSNDIEAVPAPLQAGTSVGSMNTSLDVATMESRLVKLQSHISSTSSQAEFRLLKKEQSFLSTQLLLMNETPDLRLRWLIDSHDPKRPMPCWGPMALLCVALGGALLSIGQLMIPVADPSDGLWGNWACVWLLCPLMLDVLAYHYYSLFRVASCAPIPVPAIVGTVVLNHIGWFTVILAISEPTGVYPVPGAFAIGTVFSFLSNMLYLLTSPSWPAKRKDYLLFAFLVVAFPSFSGAVLALYIGVENTRDSLWQAPVALAFAVSKAIFRYLVRTCCGYLLDYRVVPYFSFVQLSMMIFASSILLTAATQTSAIILITTDVLINMRTIAMVALGKHHWLWPLSIPFKWEEPFVEPLADEVLGLELLLEEWLECIAPLVTLVAVTFLHNAYNAHAYAGYAESFEVSKSTIYLSVQFVAETLTLIASIEFLERYTHVPMRKMAFWVVSRDPLHFATGIAAGAVTMIAIRLTHHGLDPTLKYEWVQ